MRGATQHAACVLDAASLFDINRPILAAELREAADFIRRDSQIGVGAIKVISVGEIPKEPIWRGSCRNCHSVIEAPRQVLEPVHLLKGSEHGYLDCPVCGERRGVQLRPTP